MHSGSSFETAAARPPQDEGGAGQRQSGHDKAQRRAGIGHTQSRPVIPGLRSRARDPEPLTVRDGAERSDNVFLSTVSASGSPPARG